MSRQNSICNRRPTISPPLPPEQARSPASGYSKSILCAIKDIPYEQSSGNTPSPTNASPVQSPPENYNKTELAELKEETQQQLDEQNECQTSAAILKIKVGKFDEAGKNEKRAGEAQQPEQQSAEFAVPNKQRARRSISCETALASAVGSPKRSNTLLQSSQKTQSVNRISATLAGTTPQQPSRLLFSPLPPDCSTIASSKLGSCASMHSAASCSTPLNELASGRNRQRSPSETSSIRSKDKKSTGHGQPKIRFAVFAKALSACANGQLAEFKELVRENPELITYQYPYCYRHSCLHIAAKAGCLPIVNYLVKNGANLNAKDDTWSTPLHMAAKSKQMPVIKLLREMGADPTMLDAHGMPYSAYLQSVNNGDGNNLYRYNQPYSGSDLEMEGDSTSLNNSQRSHLGSRHHNYSFHSLKKPISRAVRDLLHIKQEKK